MSLFESITASWTYLPFMLSIKVCCKYLFSGAQSMANTYSISVRPQVKSVWVSMVRRDVFNSKASILLLSYCTQYQRGKSFLTFDFCSLSISFLNVLLMFSTNCQVWSVMVWLAHISWLSWLSSDHFLYLPETILVFILVSVFWRPSMVWRRLCNEADVIYGDSLF